MASEEEINKRCSEYLKLHKKLLSKKKNIPIYDIQKQMDDLWINFSTEEQNYILRLFKTNKKKKKED